MNKIEIDEIIKKISDYKCVAIVGPIGAGKTMLAGLIAEKGLRKVTRYSFADHLRKIVSNVVMEDIESLKISAVKEKTVSALGGMTIRNVLINVATFLRSFNDNYFVDITMKKINDDEKEDMQSLVIIDDLRFDVELNALKNKYNDSSMIIVAINSPDNNGLDLSGISQMALTRVDESYFLDYHYSFLP